MEAFRFSLNRVRNYKTQLFEKEKNNLRLLNVKKDKLEQLTEQKKNYIRAKSKECQEKQKTGISALELIKDQVYLETAKQQLICLKEEYLQAKKDVERQLKITIAASQEVSSLDKLEERQWEEYQILVRKDQELLISEYVTSQVAREKKAI